MTWGTCFSSRINPDEIYSDYSIILLSFPGWTPDVLKKLTLSERKYWAQWSRAAYERETGASAPAQAAPSASARPGQRGSFSGRPV